METYVRMMVLKYRYRLGFEALCTEVSDSISWRLFCKVPLGAAVPHPSTLEKPTSRCGAEAVEQLNEVLLKKAHDNKLIKLDKVRADTTVVPADVKYPPDSDLLAKGISRLVVLTGALKAMGLAARTKTRDRRRSLNARVHAIGAWLRRRTDEAKDEVLAITAEMATLAEAALGEAAHVAANAARGLRRQGTAANGRARATLVELKEVTATLEKVVAQTKQRVSGAMPDGAGRIVSFHDQDARPIRKGRLGKPVEFGYKAQVVDNSDGVVLDYQVMKGNPADRGYGEAKVEDDLAKMGVYKVAIPRRGKPSAARKKTEPAPGFRKLVKWRTGCEGRVAALKRGYGWSRSLMDGTAGTAAWCGWGVFAHNSIKISHLEALPPTICRHPPNRPGPTGPPGAGPPAPAPAPLFAP
jgi:transposase, IS5 family